MGRSTPTSGHSVGSQNASARGIGWRIDGNEGQIVVKKDQNRASFLLPFLLGAVVGGFGGAVFGTIMAPYFAAIRSLCGKMIRRGDSDQPKFELLLQ